MRPRKTDQAHAALQTHRAGLDMRQRRVLILADGQRSLEALTAMLGADTPLHVAALIRAGYLGLAEEARPATAACTRAASQSAPDLHARACGTPTLDGGRAPVPARHARTAAPSRRPAPARPAAARRRR